MLIQLSCVFLLVSFRATEGFTLQAHDADRGLTSTAPNSTLTQLLHAVAVALTHLSPAIPINGGRDWNDNTTILKRCKTIN